MKKTRNEPECIIAPAMFHAAFRNILHELQILLYVVDSEGDWDTVAIANYYGCPILSNDSDYYMYNVEGGYIPLHRLHWEDAAGTSNCRALYTKRLSCYFWFHL